jgi:hypothetical protein
MYNTIKNEYHINKIDYFKIFVLCSSDVTADVDLLHAREFT